ncbi:unnamed protein product [Lactuca saligna]|uniref:Exportin-5 C-terminal domain-containing protein n=1 Tax=Lactuca saligna TaxID=75948 RepID=A0AA35Z834_LACSI|nr:unnamed protein product [Lactuca saligna]
MCGSSDPKKDKAIRILNVTTNAERVISEEHPISSLSVSGDNKYLIVNLNSQDIHMWDVEGLWEKPLRYKVPATSSKGAGPSILEGSWNVQLELVRLIASFKPLIAITKVTYIIGMIIKSRLLSPLPSRNLTILESMQVAMGNVLGVVFDGQNDENGSASNAQVSSCRILEGLLQQLISLKWSEPELVEVLGHYLEALVPFLEYYPDDVESGIADMLSYLQNDGQLLRDEHNLFGESLILLIAYAPGNSTVESMLRSTTNVRSCEHTLMTLRYVDLIGFGCCCACNTFWKIEDDGGMGNLGGDANTHLYVSFTINLI